jgi:hypothetical protein
MSLATFLEKNNRVRGAAIRATAPRAPAQRIVEAGAAAWRAPTAAAFTRDTPKGTVPIRLLGAPDGSTRIGSLQVRPGEAMDLVWDEAKGALLDRSGQAIMLGGMSPSDVHDPTEMATFLAGYKNATFRHPEMCQVVPVNYDEDKYRIFDSSAAFKPVQVKTDDDAPPAEIRVTSSLTNYKVVVRRIAAFIPDPTMRQVTNPGYDIRFIHMERCKTAIDLDLELDVLGPSGLLTTAANWGTNQTVTLAAGFQWGSGIGSSAGVGANSDPIHDLRNMRDNSNQRITSFWMNEHVAGIFLDHPSVRDYMRQNYGDSVPGADIKAIRDDDDSVVDFKLTGLGTFHVVCSRVENSLGTPATTGYVMPDQVIGVVQPAGVPTNGERIASAYNFRRRGPAGVGFYTREVRFEARGAGGTMIIVEEASIPTMTSKYSGGQIVGVTA